MRPVVVLTRSDAIQHLNAVTIAPVTRSVRYIPAEVVLSPEQGVPSLCAISLDNIITVPKGVFRSLITRLDSDAMTQVFGAIRHVFAMK
jgi:mRNA interferase MazF